MNSWIIVDELSGKPAIIFPIAVKLTCAAEADILLTCICAARLHEEAEVKMFGLFDAENFEISEIVIPRQSCSPSLTQSDGEKELSLLWKNLELEGKNPRLYNAWIHSHVRGSTYFSGVDDNMIEKHLKTMLFEKTTEFLAEDESKSLPDFMEAGPFISIVANVYGKMNLRVDFLCRSNTWKKPAQITFYPSLERPFQELSEEEKKSFLMDRVQNIKEKVTTLVRRFKYD